MFDPSNDEQVKKAFEYVQSLVYGGYNSSHYQEFYDRVEKREDAYYMRPRSDMPKWKSKLHFATFFLGCKSLDAQLKRTHRTDPLAWVSLEDAIKDPMAVEKSKVMQYDINHDLYIGNFREELNQMFWYLEIAGLCPAREFVTSEQVMTSNRGIREGSFGVGQDQFNQQEITRKEHTKTEWIHPLNYQHNPYVGGFNKSRWGSVRFLSHPVELYRMRGDKRYYQKGVNELIEALEQNKGAWGWAKGKDTFYSESYDKNIDAMKNQLVFYEYCGDLNFPGNMDDNNLYYFLWEGTQKKVMAARKSTYSRIPYWAIYAYPDPHGPYCIDPCAPLMPLNHAKNSTFNQYFDYTNAVQKYLWQVDPGAIVGGPGAIINGLPQGMVFVEEGTMGNAISSISRDKGSSPPVGDIMNMIDREIELGGPSSNLRGKGSNQLSDTATGISLMSQREDSMIEAIMDEVDFGIESGLHMKMQNRIDYMTQPVVGQIDETKSPVKYFPYELSGVSYTLKIKRELSEVIAGRNMSYLKLINAYVQQGLVPPEGALKLVRKIGQAMGVDEVNEMVPDAPAPVIPGNPNAQPGNVPDIDMGAMNAEMAL